MKREQLISTDYKIQQRNNPTNDDVSVSELTKNNIDEMKAAFVEMSKEMDSPLSKEEIVYFLNKNSLNGQFNRQVGDKLLMNLFSENQETISVSDFINGISVIIGEMKQVIRESQRKYIKENEKNDELQKKCNEYKDERMNNGISENAKFTISFIDVDFQENDNNDDINLYLKISMNENENYETNPFSYYNKKINQEFNFSPKTKKDKIIIELYSIDDKTERNASNFIGDIELNCESFENQEEFEVQLQIPNLKEPDKPNLLVNSKAIFIYSHYEYFSNLLEGSFALIDKLKEKIKKANDVLDCFYSLKFMDNNNNYISTNKQKDQNNIKTNVYSESNRNLQNVNSASNIKSTRGESIVTANNTYSFADTVDNLLTSRLHTRSINWVQILFVTSLIILLSVLSSNFAKNDLIGLIAIVAIIYRVFTIKQYDINKTFSFIAILIIASYGYDLLWFILCDKNCYSDNDGDCTIKTFSFVMSIINVILKGVLLTEAYIIKKRNQNKQ